MTTCKICQQKFKNNRDLSFHLKKDHNKMSCKYYYDNFLRKENEGICKTCGKETKFVTISIGYRDFCSIKCKSNSKEIKEKIKQTFLEKYGVENPNQVKDVREKIKNTCLERYGVECITQSADFKEKIKQTCLERYGVESTNQVKEIKEKKKLTCLEKYGVENPYQSEEIKEKIKQTCLERYGVNHYNKSDELRNKRYKENLVSQIDGKPLYNYWAPKISWAEEVRRDLVDNRILNVRCKKCGEWFIPNPISVNHRLQALNGNYRGELNLYCSEECKNTCSIYYKILYQEDHPNKMEEIRDPYWVKLIKENANFECEICGNKENLIAHHVVPVKLEPFQANDIENGICVCEECHKKLHKDECSTGKLSSKVC